MTSKPVSKNNQIVHREAYYCGPLPLPEMLEKYEAILPGAADRIIRMAENQLEHRTQIEKIAIKTRSRDSLLGILSGFLIGVCSLLVSSFIIIKGYALAGGLMGTTGIAGLVGVFIYGTRENRAEREKKTRSD